MNDEGTPEKRWYRVDEAKAEELRLVYYAKTYQDESGQWRALLSWDQFWQSILVRTRH